MVILLDHPFRLLSLPFCASCVRAGRQVLSTNLEMSQQRASKAEAELERTKVSLREAREEVQKAARESANAVSKSQHNEVLEQVQYTCGSFKSGRRRMILRCLARARDEANNRLGFPTSRFCLNVPGGSERALTTVCYNIPASSFSQLTHRFFLVGQTALDAHALIGGAAERPAGEQQHAEEEPQGHREQGSAKFGKVM